MWFRTVLAIALCLATGTSAKTDFLQPPSMGIEHHYRDNPAYSIGEKMDIQWTMDAESVSLLLIQQYPPPPLNERLEYVTLTENTRKSNYLWAVAMTDFQATAPAAESAIFYLAISKTGDHSGNWVRSHYFNVTRRDPTTSTSAATATSTPSAADRLHHATATPTASTAASPGLSVGAAAGLSIAATLGGVLLIAAIGFLVWRHLQIRKAVGRLPRSPRPLQTRLKMGPADTREDEKPEMPSLSGSGKRYSSVLEGRYEMA